ncbi:MAG: SsrA-binding protein SmpB [bacterium]|nr:SsrA-binding protein SmpB [bacterium]
MSENIKIIAENRKAYHDYFIEDTFDAGISLVGSEVKSVRLAKVNLKDSFCIVKNGEVFLVNANISTYDKTSSYALEPTRTRKLLLNKQEILKIERKIKIKGYACVPLKIFFKGQFAKLTIALARGKQLFDKKETIKAKDQKRETERELKNVK